MPWGRCDDGFYDHEKVHKMRLEVRNAACGLFWRGISRCNRKLSDGRLTEEDLALIDARSEEVDELVRVRLWHRLGRGYRIHDFADFNETREAVLERRIQKAEAGRKGGLASGKTRRSRSEAAASGGAKQNRSRRLKQNEAPGVELPSRPNPNPVPENGGNHQAWSSSSSLDSNDSLPGLRPLGPRARANGRVDPSDQTKTDDREIDARRLAASAVRR
jgi:hypothetical protein